MLHGKALNNYIAAPCEFDQSGRHLLAQVLPLTLFYAPQKAVPVLLIRSLAHLYMYDFEVWDLEFDGLVLLM